MQTKKQFDKETLKKIGQSFLLTLIAAFGVFITGITQGLSIDKALFISVGTIGAWLVNIAKEYLNGTEPTENNPTIPQE